MIYDYMLSLFCVIGFCLCLQQVGRHLFQPITVGQRNRFSKKALRLERAYHVAAWSLLASLIFYMVLHSFIAAFQQL